MKDINAADYDHAYKDFDTKNMGEYYDLYVQSDTLLLAEALDPAKFLSAARLTWQAALKKPE